MARALFSFPIIFREPKDDVMRNPIGLRKAERKGAKGSVAIRRTAPTAAGNAPVLDPTLPNADGKLETDHFIMRPFDAFIFAGPFLFLQFCKFR